MIRIFAKSNKDTHNEFEKYISQVNENYYFGVYGHGRCKFKFNKIK